MDRAGKKGRLTMEGCKVTTTWRSFRAAPTLCCELWSHTEKMPGKASKNSSDSCSLVTGPPGQKGTTRSLDLVTLISEHFYCVLWSLLSALDKNISGDPYRLMVCTQNSLLLPSTETYEVSESSKAVEHGRDCAETDVNGRPLPITSRPSRSCTYRE